MGEAVQKTYERLFNLKKSFLLFFLFQAPLAFSFTTSLQFSLGASSYNNNFFLNNSENSQKIKLIHKNIFSPVFKISWDIYLSRRWRLGLEGSFRTKVNFTTPKTEIVKPDTTTKEETLRLSSSLATSSVEFHVLYQVPFDFKNKGYFGVSVGYAEHFLGAWETRLYTENGEFEQVLAPLHHPAFVGKIIAGRDFALPGGFYLDFSLHFSFLEVTFTSDTILRDNLAENHAGTWNFKDPYHFPSRPLDLTLGLRKNFTF